MLKPVISSIIFALIFSSSLKASENCEFLNLSITELRGEISNLKDEIKNLKEQQRKILCTVNCIKYDCASHHQCILRSRYSLDEFERTMIQYMNNRDGINALHYAIKEGDFYFVEMMIKNGSNIYTPCSGHTPLTRAIECNQFDIALLLLKSGHDANHRLSKSSYSPLYYAAKNNSIELINLLSDFGANLDDKIQNESTNFHHT